MLFRRLFFLILLLNSLEPIIAQNGINYLYNRRDDLNDTLYDNGIKLKYWQNKILTVGVCANSNTFITQEGSLLTLTDTLGNLIWSKRFYMPNHYGFWIQDIVSFNNSSFCAVGAVYKDTINEFDLFFAKFNSVGDSVFVKIFNDTSSRIPVNAVQFSNSELVVLNSWTQDYSNAEYSKINFTKFDTLGNIVTESYQSSSLNVPKKILLDTLRKKIYVLGTYKTQPGNNYNVKSFLFTYDYSFTHLYSNNNLGTSLNDFFLNATIHRGTIYFSLMKTVPNLPNPNLFYQVQYNRYVPFYGSGYGSNIVLGPLNLYGALNVSGTEFVNDFVSCVQLTDLSTKNYLYFIDTTLQILCSAVISSTTSSFQSDYPWGILIPPNKRVYGTGRVDNNVPGLSVDHWSFCTQNIEEFLKDTCGILFSGITNTIKEEIKIRIFPNPTIDFLIIENESDSNELYYQLTNIFGQDVGFNAIKNDLTKIDLTKLSSGIYFITITEGKKRLLVKKIIKE